jgi:hypothetical protein
MNGDDNLMPIDHDPFAEENENLNRHYQGMLASEQPHQETETANILGSPLTYSHEVSGQPWSIEDENLNAGREINSQAIVRDYDKEQAAKNRPTVFSPEGGPVSDAYEGTTAEPRLSEAQEHARLTRGQEFGGNMILGATPVIGQAMGLKQAYEAGSEIPKAISEGKYASAAGSAGLAALGVSGLMPAAESFANAGNSARVFGGWYGAENLAKAGRPTAYEALSIAQHLEGKGLSPEEIWSITSHYAKERDPAIVGVHRGPGGELAFEMMDPEIGSAYWPSALDAKLREQGIPRSEIRETGTSGTLQDVLHHPDAYQAYPELAGMKWNAVPPEKMKTLMGSEATEAAYGRLPNETEPQVWLRNDLSPRLGKGYEITAHEGLGHGVQDLEGWQRGANPRAFTPDQLLTERLRRHLAAMNEQEGGWTGVNTYTPDVSDQALANQMYLHSPGEVNARNIETRLRLPTREERAASPPWTTEDVPRSKATQPQQQRQGIVSTSEQGLPPYEYTDAEKAYINPWGDNALTAYGIINQRPRLANLEQDLVSGDPKLTRQAELRINYIEENANRLAHIYGQNTLPQYDAIKRVTSDLATAASRLKAAHETGDVRAISAAKETLHDSMNQFEAFTQAENGIGRAHGGKVKRPPHARIVDGKWMVPDAKNPGACVAV